jgi:hypothetical protein
LSLITLKQAATARIAQLRTAAEEIAVAGVQLRAAVVEAGSGDHYDTLAAVANLKQQCVDLRVQLESLDQQAADVDEDDGCVWQLRLQTGARASLLQSVAQVGAIDQHQTLIRCPSVHELESLVLPPAHHDDLRRFLADNPVSQWTAGVRPHRSANFSRLTRDSHGLRIHMVAALHVCAPADCGRRCPPNCCTARRATDSI